MVEDDLKKLKHKNIDLVRENVKLRKENEELKNRIADMSKAMIYNERKVGE